MQSYQKNSARHINLTGSKSRLEYLHILQYVSLAFWPCYVKCCLCLCQICISGLMTSTFMSHYANQTGLRKCLLFVHFRWCCTLWWICCRVCQDCLDCSLPVCSVQRSGTRWDAPWFLVLRKTPSVPPSHQHPHISFEHEPFGCFAIIQHINWS